MELKALLQFLPEKDLEFLAAETNVDFQVKKLSGITIFKLILFSMLHSNRVSLRVMEEFVHHASFRSFSGFKESTRYNSIRDRIVTMNPDFFEQIFLRLFDVFSKELSEQKSIVKVDTTSIAISAKLVKWSLRSGGSNPNLRHLKLGIGVKGSLPCEVKIFTEKEATSDDVAIPETILNSLNLKEDILTFDRGVQSRNALTKLNEERFIFIGRLNKTNNYQLVSKYKVKPAKTTDSVVIQEDILCKLMNRQKQWSNDSFRVVKAMIKKSGEPIWFVTNNKELSAQEIAAIYKQRWEIEVFIKFLKQHLNLNHLVSRTENGLKVMIYMTMILAILIIVFKKKNKIASYKIAKLRFEIQLDNLLMREVILLCGGNPDKITTQWNSS